MKKLFVLVMCVVLVVTFFSCSKEEKNTSTYEIAMITTSQSSSIDDGAYNQSTWEGLREYAEENSLTYKYYEPREDSTDARLEQIDQAIQSGASVIACCGQEFEPVIYTAQEKYGDKTFLLIDGYPTDDKGNQKTGTNAIGVKFAENELGYLAGYAAVEDGYRSLGFIGDGAAASMKNYGYGFIQGCNDAAEDIGVTVDVNYSYKKDGDTAAKIQKKAETWYEEGTEGIFACGNEVFDSVKAEADIAGAKVIGCGYDRNATSKNVLTSTVKECGIAVQAELAAFYNGVFTGGKNLVLGIAEDAVGLALKTSRFEAFEQESYDALYQSLKSGELKIASSEDAQKVSGLIQKRQLNFVYVTMN